MRKRLTHLDASFEYYVDRDARAGQIFALPVELQRGEDIRAAAMNGAARNGFPSTGFVVDLSGARSFRRLSCLHESSSADDLEQLVSVLGFRPDTAQVKRLLSIERNTSRDWSLLAGLRVRRSQIASRRRVAPRSLRLEERQKAIWAFRPFAIDLETGEQLLDHCPVCNRELGWARSYGVSFCDKCPDKNRPLRGAVDLREYAQKIEEFLDPESIDFVRLLTTGAEASSPCRIHSDLSSLRGGELLQLAVKIGRTLHPGKWHDQIDVPAIEGAGRTLLGWPTSFDDLLDRVDDGRHELAHPLYRLQNDPMLSRRTRSLLKSRVDRRLPGASIKIAARPDQSSVLDQCSGSDFGKDAVTALRGATACRKLAADFGIPLPWLLDLCKAGLLPKTPYLLETAIRDAGKPLMDLMASIGRLPSAVTAEETISVSAAAFALGDVGGSRFVALLRDVLSRKDDFYLDETSSSPLWQRFRCSLDVALSTRSLMGTASFSDSAPNLKCDVALAIGKNRTIARELQMSGFLPATATMLDIVAFRKSWVFMSEVSDLIRLNRAASVLDARVLLTSCNVTRYTLPSITLWSRGDADQLLASNGITIRRQGVMD